MHTTGPVRREQLLQALEEITRIETKYEPILRQLEPMYEELRAVRAKYGLHEHTRKEGLTTRR